jgi:RimJ/RimL family protein N-acetyltransferase
MGTGDGQALDPARAPHEASFIGRRIVLVPPTREHYPLLHKWCSDPRSAFLWNNARRIPTLEQFAYELDQNIGTNVLLLIVHKRTGELLGFLQTYSPNAIDGHVSYLVYLAPSQRQTGIGAEACYLMMDYLFTYYPYRKIYAESYEFNSESRRMIENAGFVQEAHFKEHVWYDDRYWDLYKYAFYRAHWPKMRQRLQRLFRRNETGEEIAVGSNGTEVK